MIRLRTLLAAGALALAGTTTHAAVISGSAFTPGLNTQVVGGIEWFTLPDTSGFAHTTLGNPAFTGVGVAGGDSGNEIGLDEGLAGFTLDPAGVGFTSITIGMLFDGPEFDDVNEVATVIVFFADGTSAFNTLVAIDADTATWDGTGTVTTLSPATEDQAAVWRIDDPFAGRGDIFAVILTASTGQCGTAGGACTNDSDFALVELVTTAVPEPASMALFGLGLAALGLARRRR